MKMHPNWQDADLFYAQLLAAHEGLSLEDSQALNARLILLLANQVGDSAILAACLEAAKSSGTPANA